MNPEKVVLGIVAEYDPFHNGHAYHLEQARNTVRPDTVYAVLSPCMKQRGELSMFSPHMRACCAVRAGVDAVFSLPVLWTVRDAEHYALGAVSLLCGLGITHLSFGAETKDLKLLQFCADFLDHPPCAFPDRLHTLLKKGIGYPAALSESISFFLPQAADVFSRPNNILGVCYLRALKKTNPSVVPVLIPRRGAYHDITVDPASPSASSLRSALIRGDYSSAFRAMPPLSSEAARRAFLSGSIPDVSVWNTLLLNTLRTRNLSLLPDLSEGLGDALKKLSLSAHTVQDLIAGLVSKRYTASRISRLCTMAALGVTDERIRSLPLPSLALLTALRKRNVPTERWKDLPVRVVSSSVEWKKYADPEDILSWRLRSLCCHLPDTLPFTEKIYTE